MIYDKENPDYKYPEKKKVVWKELAVKMDIPASDLQHWLRQMRTRLGKLSKVRSGQVPKELTERDKWIVEKLGFLTRFVKICDPYIQGDEIKSQPAR